MKDTLDFLKFTNTHFCCDQDPRDVLYNMLKTAVLQDSISDTEAAECLQDYIFLMDFLNCLKLTIEQGQVVVANQKKERKTGCA